MQLQPSPIEELLDEKRAFVKLGSCIEHPIPKHTGSVQCSFTKYRFKKQRSYFMIDGIEYFIENETEEIQRCINEAEVMFGNITYPRFYCGKCAQLIINRRKESFGHTLTKLGARKYPISYHYQQRRNRYGYFLAVDATASGLAEWLSSWHKDRAEGYALYHARNDYKSHSKGA